MVKASTHQRLPLSAAARHCAFWLGLVTVSACSKAAGGGAAKSTALTTAVPVVVAVAKSEDLPLMVPALGLVEAYRTVQVVSQAAGRIEAVHFREGDVVREGDLLFSLDNRPYRAALNEAKARLNRNAALAEQASSQVKRTQSLVEPGLIAPEEAERVRTDLAAAQAGVQADRSTLRVAELSLQYTAVRAPIGGRTGALLVHPGNVVKATAETPLVTIRQTSPIFVRFAVPATELANLQAALASGEVQVEVTPRGISEQVIERGVLTLIDNQIGEQTAKIELKAKFENSGQRLWPGQAVDVRVIVGYQRGATLVPEAAVVYGQSGPYVFVCQDGARVRVVPVKLGPNWREWVVLESGVRPGDQVVIDGQLRLIDGTEVKVVQAPPKIGGSTGGDASVPADSTATATEAQALTTTAGTSGVSP